MRKEVEFFVAEGDVGVDVDLGGQEFKVKKGAETYVWVAGEEELEDGEWDFKVFREEKMRRWMGQGEGEGVVDEGFAGE